MKLKPCPFCGGEVSIVLMGSNGFGYWMITRGHKENACTCRVFMESNRFVVDLDGNFDGTKQKEDLIQKWNRREPIDRIVEQLEEKADEANDKWMAYGQEDDYFDGKEDGIREAIEIVEGGAV